MKPPDRTLDVLWQFVRGELQVLPFERWVYQEPDLERLLGTDLYLGTISTDFSDPYAVRGLRFELAAAARARWPFDCLCIRLKDLDVVDMGAINFREPAFESERSWCGLDVFQSLDEVKTRGAPYWWLWAARCRVCGQAWLVGSEERQNDVDCMKRLTAAQLQGILQDGQWPPDFDSYETLLSLGGAAGVSYRFLDPMNSSMLVTIADLARERPGISIPELATLLGVGVELAGAMARKVIETEGLQITFE